MKILDFEEKYEGENAKNRIDFSIGLQIDEKTVQSLTDYLKSLIKTEQAYKLHSQKLLKETQEKPTILFKLIDNRQVINLGTLKAFWKGLKMWSSEN